MPWPFDDKPVPSLPFNAMQYFRTPRTQPVGNAMANWGLGLGLLQPGNMDMNLSARPQVPNSDGSISTVRSMSFGTDEGEVLVPTVSDDGRIMSDDEAMQNYYRTGRHMGVFANPDLATAYADMIHRSHENALNKRKR